MTDRNRHLTPLGLAQVHNVYGTLGVLSIKEIRDEIKDIDFARENAIDLAQIHNIYGALGAMTAKEMREHLGLREVVDFSTEKAASYLVLKALRQRLELGTLRVDGVVYIDDGDLDRLPFWLQSVNEAEDTFTDAYGRTFTVKAEQVHD